MVNLSSCSPGKVFLDPFCGVGTILQEAVLAKAQTIGIDMNPWCVEASRRNLDWLKSEYNLANAKYTVMFGDSRNLTKQIGKETVDCVATEPDLGPALRHVPTVSYASGIVDELKPLYFDFLEESYKVLKRGGRLVFVAPYIRTRSGEFITLNIEERARCLGFKTVSPFKKDFFAEGNRLAGGLIGMSCFVDIEKRHKIGRKIHILQK
jgi:tRNA G10  N-methylase Trm11